MKCAHYVKVRVLAKPEEDKEQIEKSLRDLVPFNIEDEKINLEKHSAEGFGDRKIMILEVTLQKDRHINVFLKDLVEKLGEKQCRLILEQIESRLDEHLIFYLRLEKQTLMLGTYELTDTGDCFHIHFSVACFPKSREAAITTISDIFGKSD